MERGRDACDARVPVLLLLFVFLRNKTDLARHDTLNDRLERLRRGHADRSIHPPRMGILDICGLAAGRQQSEAIRNFVSSQVLRIPRRCANHSRLRAADVRRVDGGCRALAGLGSSLLCELRRDSVHADLQSRRLRVPTLCSQRIRSILEGLECASSDLSS